MAKKYPSETLPKFLVRMPPDLKKKVKSVAAREGRSMNSQIVQMLRQQLEQDVA